ncbi:MAG: hypothetical protein CMO44_18905 [Verrucomicrobiales bacterium]|nr:hypothetical protein [Verrucomicrobiales bacterium]|tara:strand:- start:2897 stop:3232 length:336 start_codon:yes stop_codon:yes gene_type:complete
MAEKIKLVQGDSLPSIKLTLTDPTDGVALDLSDATTVVKVYFRAVGSAQVLSAITCTKVGGGTAGVVRFDFSGGVLNVPPGPYEGEIEISFAGQLQTVYDKLKFFVREDFA